MANTKLADAVPGTILKIKISGADKDFVVLQHGYPAADSGYTLLWQKSIWQNSQYGSNHNYANSTIDTLLTQTYFPAIDEPLRSMIPTVSIPYIPNGDNTSGSEMNKVLYLDRKVFILSATELGLKKQGDGTAIAYFDANNKRVVQLNGVDSRYYTRSPKNINSKAYAEIVENNGLLISGIATTTTSAGIVPALCLPSESLYIDKNGNFTTESGLGSSIFIPASELEQGVEYYFRVYPRNHQNQFQTGIDGSVVTAIPGSAKVMTAVIDLSDSNPATCVSYADDAANMTAGSAEWDEFFGHYPCLFKDGVEVGKLNPNDFSKFADGTDADITSGAAGDVMIAFPRRGVKITTSGTKVTVSMTNGASEDGFSYLAHQRGDADKDMFYLGAYKGFVDSGKLRSLSGKTPTVKQYIKTFRTQAQAQGAGYEQSAFYQLVFRQCMYILKYKNLNSQQAVGMGYVYGNSGMALTGNTNAKGMDFGSSDTKTQMKLFGIEDFWGNPYEWVDGIVTDASRNLLTGTDNFNDSGSGYTNLGQATSANLSGFMVTPQGTEQAGFIGKTAGGSTTTYFCDQVIVNPSCIVQYGGSWTVADSGGIFMLYLANASSYIHNSIGSRLMYL